LEPSGTLLKFSIYRILLEAGDIGMDERGQPTERQKTSPLRAAGWRVHVTVIVCLWGLTAADILITPNLTFPRLHALCCPQDDSEFWLALKNQIAERNETDRDPYGATAISWPLRQSGWCLKIHTMSNACRSASSLHKQATSYQVIDVGLTPHPIFHFQWWE
jgi:hypothetical protein